jgi:uncharacterized hydrophobic protein (TIGR00271 family)
MGRRLEKLLDWFDLRAELEDYDFIHETITQGIVFRGTNLWILMFAIMVCSVGLNMNSTAVIIGAMLISPLMGPINGMGYGLATYDFPLFERSLKNLAFALGVSLLTSAFYFILSPLNEAHSELLARTSPSIYDVIIAFFGGLAGIVAVSSKFKGNVIPGVAIATALMPPICTAGYGLATLQWNFFFGALYLFTINTVFIAFAVLIVCRLLKFPIRSIVDPEKKRKVTHGITVIILATFVPSIFFGYRLVKKEEFSRNSRAFIDAVALLEGNYLQGNRVNPSTGTVELFYSGYGLSDSLIAVIKERALAYRLDTSKITIHQGFEASLIEEKTRIYQTETEILNNKIKALSFALMQREHQMDSILNIPVTGERMLKEIKPLYPQIQGCTYAETFSFTFEKDTLKQLPKVPLVVFKAPRNSLRVSDKRKIEEWLRNRLNNEGVNVLFDETTK